MKKLLKIGVCCLLLIGCATQTTTPKADITGINEISYKKLQSLMKKNISFILYIGRPDCGDCQEFHPILEAYLKAHKNTGVYYLNIKAYRDAAKKKTATTEEKTFFKNLYKTFDFDWTPTLEVISHGKITKKYKYLDEAYYEITDRQKQIAKRKEFVASFKTFMNHYYKEG